jgi:hypothetical protein
VPPFNACFEAGLAAGFEAEVAVDAKIAATSITTPRLANTADSSVLLRIGLLPFRCAPHSLRGGAIMLNRSWTETLLRVAG